MLKAGCAIADISPEKGVGLAGYPHCPRPNEGVHDPLCAGVIYLDDGKNRVAFVTLDLLYFGKQYVRRVREKFDFPVMFTATHTHSGPWASEVLASEKSEGIECDAAYMDFLCAALEEAIGRAAAETFDAVAGTGVGHCGAESGVGGNRRDKDGPCNPNVNVLAVRDTQGRVRGALVNYALHPTFLHSDNLLCSADYPGYIRRFFHFAFPDAVLLFAQGTSGNQSSRSFRVAQNFEEACRVGTTLGAEAARVIRAMEFSDKLPVTVRSKEIELPLRVFPPIPQAERELAAAQAAFDAVKDADYMTRWNAELKLFGAQNILTYSRMAGKSYVSPELPCEIMTVALGDTVIVGIQGEIFVEFGLAVQEASPYKHTFVFEVTNGTTPGYIYTREAGLEGGYEVGTSMLSPETGYIVIDTVKELL